MYRHKRPQGCTYFWVCMLCWAPTCHSHLEDERSSIAFSLQAHNDKEHHTTSYWYMVLYGMVIQISTLWCSCHAWCDAPALGFGFGSLQSSEDWAGHLLHDHEEALRGSAWELGNGRETAASKNPVMAGWLEEHWKTIEKRWFNQGTFIPEQPSIMEMYSPKEGFLAWKIPH